MTRSRLPDALRRQRRVLEEKRRLLDSVIRAIGEAGKATELGRHLFRDVEAVLDQDPAGETAQALAERWIKLVEAFTGGDPEIAQGVKNLYADRVNWSADFQRKTVPYSNPKVWDFMNRAIAIRKR